jgi:hypothetical protein
MLTTRAAGVPRLSASHAVDNSSETLPTREDYEISRHYMYLRLVTLPSVISPSLTRDFRYALHTLPKQNQGAKLHVSHTQAGFKLHIRANLTQVWHQYRGNKTAT